MKTAWVLGACVLLLIPRLSYADKAAEKRLEAELKTTLTQLDVVVDQIDRLESLLASLAENKAQFAGYGVFRHEDDLNRIRQQLYKARALQGELTARKLYIRHVLDTKTSWEKRASPTSPDSLVPTPNPESCDTGALNVDGSWFCMKPVPAGPPVPQPQKPDTTSQVTCPLGTIEHNGKTYCLGEEPGSEASWENSLGTILLDESGQVVEAAPDANPSLVNRLRLK